MKKKDRVKSNILFNEIINKGRHVSNKSYILCMENKKEENVQFGIAVGKKIGNAVVRNKIKRQIRNIVDRNYDIFPKFHNYIIICKKEILNLSFKEMENTLINLIKKGETYEK